MWQGLSGLRFAWSLFALLVNQGLSGHYMALYGIRQSI